MQQRKLAQIFLGTLNAEKTAIYTVPETNKQTVIRDLSVYNQDATDTVEVKLYINDITVISQKVEPKDSLFVGKDWYLVLNPGDVVAAETTKANTINAIISGAETVD